MFRWYDAARSIFENQNKSKEARRDFFLKVKQKVDDCIEKVNKGIDSTAQAGFFAHIIKNSHNEKKGLTRAEMDSNATTFLGAGSETTATILSGVTYLLLANPDKYKKLVHEIRSRFSSAEEITTDALNDIEYLGAVFQEGLRMFPPVSTGIPRFVPRGGAKISGYYIPGGYTVLVNQHAANLSTRNFKDPEKFVPERWLGDAKYKDDKFEVAQPFGFGATPVSYTHL